MCVTTEEAKGVASTDGMRRTAQGSPYFSAWLTHAPRLTADLRAALLAQDLPRVGELAEASALAMHASALAAGVVYFRGATWDALAAVQGLRKQGRLAYATMDAGPHVKVLVRAAEAEGLAAILAQVPGVLRVLRAVPGDGARLVDDAAPRGLP